MKEREEERLFSVLMNDGGEEVNPITGEKVVKPGEETPGEETTPPGKKEEESPPGEGVTGEKTDQDKFAEDGRLYRNIVSEAQRNQLQAEQRERLLQQKIQELEAKGKQAEADELESVLKKVEEEIKDSEEPLTLPQLKRILNAHGNRQMHITARHIGPIMASQNVIEAQIGRLKGQDGFEPKAESLLRSNLRDVPPEVLVGNPIVIANKIYAMTIGELVQGGKIGVKPKPTKKTPAPGAPAIESPGVSPAKGKKAPSEAEKKEAEDKHMSVEALRRVKAKREQGKKDREKK